MKTTAQIAKHFRELHFGGNWTASNLKEQLKDITWEQATTQVYQFNTIATLIYHTGYYVDAVLKVFQGEPLNAKDEFSFNHPPVQSQKDWEDLLEKTWKQAELFAEHVEQLPDELMSEFFTDQKYGSYYRNLHGIIEHTHYHLGQIVLIKRIVQQVNSL